MRTAPFCDHDQRTNIYSLKGGFDSCNEILMVLKALPVPLIPSSPMDSDHWYHSARQDIFEFQDPLFQ
jgi:adenine C2-methylase RlmN of 23S rRNA A2503 and tRNA A37